MNKMQSHRVIMFQNREKEGKKMFQFRRNDVKMLPPSSCIPSDWPLTIETFIAHSNISVEFFKYKRKCFFSIQSSRVFLFIC